MPQDATCTSCKHVFPVTEARQPFTVPCPKCETDLTIEFKKPATPPEAGQPPYELFVKPGALPNSAPTPSGKKRDDDDDDEPKRRGGSAMIVLLSGGLGLMFVLGGLGLTAWYLFTQIDMTETVSNNSNSSNNNNNNSGGNPKGGNPKGGNPKGNPKGGNPDPFNPPKPKDSFDLRPVTGTLPTISAPNLPSDVSNLDMADVAGAGAKVGAVAVGGGGRYIVMHFPDKGLLGVFDVNTARVATVPADNGDIHLTAGLSKVVTCVSNGSIFRVYSLPSLAKLYDTSAPGGMHGMAMGSRTNGPMLTVMVFGDVKLWDVGDGGMTEVEGANIKPQPEPHWHQKGVRALPDGTAFSTHDGFADRNKTILLTVQNRKWKTSADTFAAPFPGPDGNFYGNGVVINKNYQDQRFGGIGAGSNNWFLPSVSSKDYFLKLIPQTVGKFPKEKRVLTVSVHKNKNSDVVAAGTTVLSDQPEFEGFVDRFRNEPAVVFDQHIFLIPEAKVLVTLNQKRDRLVLRKLDLR